MGSLFSHEFKKVAKVTQNFRLLFLFSAKPVSGYATLVTGCSTGIGRDAVIHLSEQGTLAFSHIYNSLKAALYLLGYER